jgi:hypothetical protein
MRKNDLWLYALVGGGLYLLYRLVKNPAYVSPVNYAANNPGR